MSVKVWAIFAASALLLVGFASSGRHAHRQTQLRVTMTVQRCLAAPIEVKPGTMVFRVVNRTSWPRIFTIAGRRTKYIQPGRSGALRVELEHSGIYRYFCLSRGPNTRLRTGVVAVRPPPVPPPPPSPNH